MQFSDTTNRNGIIQLLEKETRLGYGVISGNASPDYHLDYFTVLINQWLHKVNHWIHQVNDEAIFDDINNTGDIPEEFNFTDDTQSYTLDADITKIRKVEAYDIVAEDWYDIDYYYESDRIEDLYGQDKAKPSKYFIQGRKIIFDVPIKLTEATKYRITYDRHAHEFVVGDTTAEPGFDKQFHEILAWGALMDWAQGKYDDIYNKARIKVFGQGDNDENALKSMILTHYKSQNYDMKYKIKRENINYE